jgi:hypothetical protein
MEPRHAVCRCCVHKLLCMLRTVQVQAEYHNMLELPQVDAGSKMQTRVILQNSRTVGEKMQWHSSYML